MDSKQQFDSELCTYFGKLQIEIKKEDIEYLNKHPEFKQILKDFTSQTLLDKPDNVYSYVKDYFLNFKQEKDTPGFKPIVFSGPSGVGKGTLLTKLMEQYPEYFKFSVSYTTRSARQGEVHGKHYYFVSKEEFQREIQKNAFIEYAEVHGNYYGTHASQIQEVRKQGKICLIEIDVKGAEKINSILQDDCNFVFITAPSLAVLRERLTKRGTETEDVINKRVKNAEWEIQRFQELGIYTELINDDFEDGYRQLIQLMKEFYPSLRW